MALRLSSLFLLLGVAQAGFPELSDFVFPFCTHGISKANFSDNEPVQVIFAQSPLFSTSPAIGQKGKYLNLFHESIVLAQGAGSTRRYWTLEFDFIRSNSLESIVPEFRLNISAPGGVTMLWHNNARYCLSEGILNGEKHWTQRFDVLFDVTASQMRRTFTDFVGVINTSTPDTKPQYQLWRVAKKWPDSEMLVQDITCAHGPLWFINHLTTVHKAMLPPNFEFKATAAIINAESVTPVDMNDGRAVDSMVLYFKLMAGLIGANKSVAGRLFDLAGLVVDKKKYVYDPNGQVYYEVSGNKAPWIAFEYARYPLMGPPWVKPNSTGTMIV